MNKKAGLIILDGWGYTEHVEGNAIRLGNVPNFNKYFEEYPHSFLIACGEAVGLPEGQMGNSEVGHLNIGAGRVMYQPLKMISNEMKDGSFFKRPNLVDMFERTRESNKKLHFIGLLSDGGVHSHIEHLKGLLEEAKRQNINDVVIHVILDGRDVFPDSGKGFVEDIQKFIDELGIGTIATVSGRFYAMDRDNRWERIKKAYDAIVFGQGEHYGTALEAIEASYAAGVTDEFFVPCVIDPSKVIEEGDTVLFYNFRPDRGRELTRALAEDGFTFFERKDLNLNYYTMTQYDSEFKNVRLIITKDPVKNTIGEYLSSLGKKQFRTAETEKYAHVTFFLNGGREEPFEGESRKLVPSPKVTTYDLKPEMSAYEVCQGLIDAIESDEYDFFVCNFANPDMVGHTGVLEAAIKAVESVDECLGKILPVCRKHGFDVIVTADHGNADEMLMPDTHKVSTQHSLNPVPMFIFSEDIKEVEDGKLCDIAPTLLDMMDIKPPAEFTGKSLIRSRK